jgi:hypothetical protein
MKKMFVKPKPSGAKHPKTGKLLLPSVPFEGTHRRFIPAAGAEVVVSGYYLRKINFGDLEVVEKVPASVKPADRGATNA